MAGMRCLVWLLLVLGLACGVGDGRAAVGTFLGGTSVQEFATTVTPESGGWRYAGYDRYAAYGTRVQEALAGGVPADRFRANSKEEDPTGLLNEGFRYRDLETGTFISRDPLGLVDGPNVYCYVRQNPWTAWDPEGLWGTVDHNAPAPTGIMRFFSAHHYAMLNARGYRVGRDLVRMNQLRVAGTKAAMVVPPVVAPLIVGAAMTAPAVAAAPEAAVAWAASRYPLATATTIATTSFLEATGQLPFALPSPKSRSFSGSQCFPAGTPVWTSDGSVCIESIRPGDVILTRSQKSGKPVACEVTRVFVHEYTGEFVTITLSGGECVTSTKNHPFRVLAGEGLASRPNSVDAGSDASLVGPSGARWVDAADLRLGDVTWTSNGPQAITGIIRDYRSATVYNLGVSLERTYLVGESGVLVHNKTLDVDMGGGGTLPRAYNAAEANPLELPGAGTVGAPQKPPLKRIHSEKTYANDAEAAASLEFWRTQKTGDIVESLKPGTKDSLVTWPDGRMRNGNTRTKVLEERGYDADKLPREVIEFDELKGEYKPPIVVK